MCTTLDTVDPFTSLSPLGCPRVYLESVTGWTGKAAGGAMLWPTAGDTNEADTALVGRGTAESASLGFSAMCLEVC